MGLAGSSAIIVATLRCLMEFYERRRSRGRSSRRWRLAVETEELGIAAGLQDRVIQVVRGPGLHGLRPGADAASTDGYRYGVYEPLDPALLPPVYIAYSADVSEPTEVFHNDIRGAVQPRRGRRWWTRDGTVRRAGRRGPDGARWRRHRAAGAADERELRHAAVDLPAARRRRSRWSRCARSVGASAKFAGSGGAIIGIYRDEAMFEALAAGVGGNRLSGGQAGGDVTVQTVEGPNLRPDGFCPRPITCDGLGADASGLGAGLEG